MVGPIKPIKVHESHSSLLKKSAGFGIFGRHTFRDRSGNVTEDGREQAHWSGKHLPKGFKPIERYSSKAHRALETTERQRMGYEHPEKSAKELAKEPIRSFDELAEEYEHPLLSQIGPRKSLFELKISGMQILQDLVPRIRARIKEGKRPLFLGVSHMGLDLAILSALGLVNRKEDIEELIPRRKATKANEDRSHYLAPTEGFLFYFLRDGRVVLSFRKRKFDITNEINKLVENKK